jgi:hypothetical protein
MSELNLAYLAYLAGQLEKLTQKELDTLFLTEVKRREDIRYKSEPLTKFYIYEFELDLGSYENSSHEFKAVYVNANMYSQDPREAISEVCRHFHYKGELSKLLQPVLSIWKKATDKPPIIHVPNDTNGKWVFTKLMTVNLRKPNYVSQDGIYEDCQENSHGTYDEPRKYRFENKERW